MTKKMDAAQLFGGERPKGKTWYNRRWRVNVTSEIVKESIERHSGYCMVAEALKIAIPTAQYVAADLATIRWTDPQTRLRYICFTPRNAQNALIDFDNGIKPKPFTYEIRGAQIIPIGRDPVTKRRRIPATMRSDGTGDVPVKIGGRPPPTGALAGTKRTAKKPGVTYASIQREYGLRSLKR